jgi:N-acetylmuramoyl-L-alanine amidase
MAEIRYEGSKDQNKYTSKYVYLLDNGHGGIIDGVYQTTGKRSPKFDDGRQLFEGEYNRAVTKRLCQLLEDANISHFNLVPEEDDISLSERIKRANNIHKLNGKSIYVSIHANAHGDGWNSANGIETYYFAKDGNESIGGKKLANLIHPEFAKAADRRDRGVKGANFYVLRNTSMPSVLTESPFMTNKEEAELMLSNEFRDKIALGHFSGILEIEKSF